MTWQSYHPLADIHGYLDYLANTYPQFVNLQTIGTSVEGRPLRVLKISSNRPGSPAIWIDGGERCCCPYQWNSNGLAVVSLWRQNSAALVSLSPHSITKQLNSGLLMASQNT
jgi:hypothetical protein